MKRREFLTTSSGALCFTHLVRLKNTPLRGKLRRRLNLAPNPMTKQMQKLKDLGFDGIEGSGPGLAD